MNIVLKTIRDTVYFLVGLGAFLVLLLVTLLSLPIYVYRWIVCKLIAPWFHPRIGKAVTSFGVTIGLDYCSKQFHSRPSRCTLLVSIILDGTLPFEGVVESVGEKWIRAKVPHQDGRGTCGLRYPELQQYVEGWLGFLFWKQDEDFDLSNHVFLQHVDKQCLEGEGGADRYISQVTESLLNKPFPPKRSPWEMHVVQGYRNDELHKATGGGGGGDMTILILRVHHVLADGFSILNAILEQLFEVAPSTLKVVTPTEDKSGAKTSVIRNCLSCLQFPLRLFYDMGASHLNNWKPQMGSPWHVPDERKMWRNSHGISELISVEKVNKVKERFGVSFTAVLYSCMSAALARDLEGRKMRRFQERVKYLPVSATLPLTGERRKMRNRWTLSIVDLPIGQNLDRKERLIQCEKSYITAKRKALPIFMRYLFQIVGSNLAQVAAITLLNRGTSAGLSSFVGPTTQVEFKGRKALSAGFAFNNCTGIAGLGFQVISYAGFFRITATAENGVMGREELNQLLRNACDELEALHEMAMAMEDKKISDCSTVELSDLCRNALNFTDKSITN